MHKGPRLLDFIGTKAASKTLHWLKSKKVDVRLEQTVKLDSIKEGDKIYQTSFGDTIVADCHFLCTSKNLGSAWLEDTEFKDDLDVLGRLKVDEYLRVRGHTNVFAIGDITDVPVSSLLITFSCVYIVGDYEYSMMSVFINLMSCI